MNDYIFLMHNDAPMPATADGLAAWDAYFSKLRATGQFSGGSAIGRGICATKAKATRGKAAKGITSHLSGYIRVQAHSLEEARMLLDGNPVFEAGGTVEIRELPRD